MGLSVADTRRLLFSPCSSREHFHEWVRTFLHIDLPSVTVSEESNTNPLDAAWEHYEKLLRNDLVGYSRAMVYSCRGGFKCNRKGTKLLGRDRGLVNIEEVKKGDIIWSGWGWRKVTDWIHDGVKESILLTLQDGQEVEGSPVHRFWTWSPGSLPTWKRSEDITKDDFIMLDTAHGYAQLGDFNQSQFELGYLCGILQGDGGLSFMEKGTVSLTGMPGPAIDFWLKFCQNNNFNVTARKQFPHSKATTYIVNSKNKLVPYLKELGLKACRSWEKEIPSAVLTNRSAMAGFVTGLFDTDGSVDKAKGHIIFQLTATKMMTDFQVLLRALGVNSRLNHLKLGKLNKHPVSVITVNKTELPKLLAAGVAINKGNKNNSLHGYDKASKNVNDFLTKPVLEQFLKLFPVKGGRWNRRIGVKPRTTHNRISREKCLELIRYGVDNKIIDEKQAAFWLNIFANKWIQVKNIERRTADFYDLTVEVDHSYWSNGVISHNTLSAAILETMVILHTKRNVAHMAAIEPQAKKSASYIKNFFKEPVLRDFTVGDNARELQVERYVHKKTGAILTLKEFEELDPGSQILYDRYANYLKLIICTMAGANSEHVEFFCVDGDTQILVKSNNPKRDRVARTARGIFQRLAGRAGGGRPGGEVTEEILEPHTKIEFLALNIDTGALEFQPVTRAQRHFRETLKIEAGTNSIVVTPDHPLFVYGRGYVQAGQISVGDRLLRLGKAKTEVRPVEVNKSYNCANSVPDGDPWEQTVIGSLLGDCGVYKRPQNNPYLQEQHCLEQKEYLDWKRSILSRKLRTVDIDAVSGYTGKPMVGFRSGCSPLLLPYLGVRENPSFWVEKLTPLGLAIWYMDDGCAQNGFRLSTEGFSKQENENIARALKDRFGIETTVSEYLKEGRPLFYIRGGIDAKRKLVDIVKTHVHPKMAYKFDLQSNKQNCKFCGIEFWFYEQGRAALNCGSALCQKIQSLTYQLAEVTQISQAGQRWVYDFTLANTHNFFGNGFLNHQCVDEVDVVLKQNVPAYYQAQNIPDPRDGLLPLTLLTSTRKSRIGLVQQEIDKSEETGLKVKHWNLIDITEACKSERHKPELPKKTYYVNDDKVTHIPKEEYDILNPGAKAKWYPVEGFAGCGSCRLFAACKGRLATHQTGNSKMLKPIEFAIAKFQEAPTPEFLNTEFLCRKPDSTGLVYPRLNPEVHLLELAKMIELVEPDENVAAKYPGKSGLIRLLKEKGAKFYAGMDFGFTHLFAVVVIAVFGQYVFVIDCYAQSGLELEDQIANCSYIKDVYGNCPIYADPAYPGSIKSFKTKGYLMKKWDKGPGSVKAGIEIVRSFIWNARGSARLLFLQGDEGVMAAFGFLEKYKFRMDVTGQPTEEPDETGDDIPDALRYVVMNVLGKKEGLKDSSNDYTEVEVTKTVNETPVRPAWLQTEINRALGTSTDQTQQPIGKIKKGRFFFSG